MPNPLFQLAVLITARFWTANYAWWVRERLCLEAGIAQEVMDAVRERRRPTFAAADQEAVYDYVTELLDNRKVSDATHARLQQIIGDRSLIELVLSIGFYSMLGLSCDAFEPDLPPGVTPPLAG